MRLLDLRLTAFGPFTGERIGLDEGAEGFHVVFGPNEAGKSSALRAIDAALFGIHGQTSDNFLHNYQDLCIGASLRRSDGRRIEFVRRKGNKATLRDPSGDDALPDDALASFLRGVDRGVFNSMFGLSRDALVAGGREVVAGKGRLGELLFAAGSGLSGVRRTLDALRRETAELYKRSAQKPQINQVVARLDKLRKELRDLQAQSGEWVKINEQFQQALAERDEVESELRRRRIELRRRTRIRDVLPLASKQDVVREILDRLAGAPLLTTDFSERRRSAEFERDNGLKQLQELEREIQSLDEALAQPLADGALAEQSEDVESLYGKLKVHNKAADDLPAIRMEERQFAEDARRRLAELRPGVGGREADFAGLSRVEAAKIEDLASRFEKLAAAREQFARQIELLKSEYNAQREQRANLGPVVDVSELRAALDDLAPHGDLEARLADISREIQAERQELSRLVVHAGVWSGEPEELESLPLPDASDVDGIDEVRRRKLDQIESIRQNLEKSRRKLQDVEAELQKLSHPDAAPTEQQLAEARRLRDGGLRCVKKALADGSEPADAVDFIARIPGAHGLVDAFERSLLQADDLADRMRRDADAVARRRNAEIELKAGRDELARAQESLQNVQDEVAEIDERWRELWAPCGIAPRSPREMKKWLQAAGQIADRVRSLRKRRAEADRIKERLAAAHARLARRLAAHGVEAPATLAEARAAAGRIAQEAADRNRAIEAIERSLEKQAAKLREAEASLRQADRNLDDWGAEWASATATIGLDADASPAEARTVVQLMQEAAYLVELQRDRLKRIEEIERDAEAFRRRVAEVCARLAPDLRERPAEEAAEELYRRMVQARQDLVRRNQQQAAYQELLDKRTRLTRSIEEARVRLQGLCREAGCEHPDQLAECEARFEELREARRRFDETQERLLEIAAGEDLDTLLQEARSVSMDETEVEIARLTELAEELELRKSRLNEQVGELRTRLNAFGGEAYAACLREDLESERAKFLGLAGRYVRLRLAQTLLDEAVRRYREENEAPILRRAGAIFADLTLGSFSGLTVDFTDDGQPILMGVRGDSRATHVEGMSEGTADQLYLALRLAALEAYLEDEGNEPMPLILDDVLVNFDDDRAQAALKVLEEFSQRTQIIFFTHHRHLVDLAKAAVRSENLFVHELRPPLARLLRAEPSVSEA